VKRLIGFAAILTATAFGVVFFNDINTTGGSNKVDTASEQGSHAEVLTSAIQTYARIVLASYEDTLSAAQLLDSSIRELAADPSPARLSAARNAWLRAREPYLQTEVFRFYGGPIDDREGLLNAWPMDEMYIDYVADNPEAGIINKTEQTIDAATLESLNEQGGEANIATGYHAIEFLLWGQDAGPDTTGQRPATDYLDGGTASNQSRRRLYLTTISHMLVGHITGLRDSWAEGKANYRQQFESEPTKETLRRILTGMMILSGLETGGERLQTALDSGDQEDEHSCFSDNTHRDMIQDVKGIENVWLGAYVRPDGTSVSGTGINSVVAMKDAALAKRVTAAISASLAAAEALQPPFDQEIALGNTAGRSRVKTLIDSLRTQEKLLQNVFQLFELDIPATE
jgi:putative iron-regulated protein